MFKILKIIKIFNDKKQWHSYKGKLCEYYVFFFLLLKGYRPIKHRAKLKTGEIDLLMRHKNTLIAIEVKYRNHIDDALYSITMRQKQRIRNSLNIIHGRYKGLYLRCDVCAVGRKLTIKHIINAF